MKIEELAVPDAIALGLQQPYAYITRLSCVELGHTPTACPTAELLEARFFGDRQEIRLYWQADELHAVRLEEEDGDVYIEKKRKLRDPKFGTHLTLRQYITYDDDGQGSIRTMRLVKWEG